jgi:hypothetical protein
MSWALLVHSETGLSTVVNNDPGVIKIHEDHGWERRAFPEWVDPDAPNAAERLADGEPVDTEPILDPETVNGLKGEALANALDVAGLPKSGTADEKRAKLAEHEAELAETTTTEEGVE